MSKNNFNGFEVLDDAIDALRTGGVGSSKKESDPVNKINDEDELSDDEIESIIENNKRKATGKTEDIEDPNKNTEDPEDNKEDLENKEDRNNQENNEEIEETEEDESISLMWDAFKEYTGFEFDEESNPKSVEDFFDTIKNKIKEESKPKYSNNIVKEIDEFVANGGDIQDYFNVTKNEIDIENIDLNVVDNQIKILTEFLSRKGFSRDQISKKIERYQDYDVLQDESADAYDSLRDMIKEEKERLLIDQENFRIQQENQQQEYFTNVVNEIEAVKDIRGIKIPEKDKKELLNYIFKVEADGTTRYQKDYNKSVKNLIESAYFTMKGDTLITNARKSGESEAVKRFKTSLSNKKANINKSSGSQSFKDDDMFSTLYRQLRNN